MTVLSPLARVHRPPVLTFLLVLLGFLFTGQNAPAQG
jgi:hypothetical protein